MDDVCGLCATELLRLYRSRALSPVEVTAAVLRRADAVQPVLNPFVHLDEAGAMAAARTAEAAYARGEARPLEGVPVAVKDAVTVQGWVFGRGSLMANGTSPAAADAPAVARLRAAGAVLFASTTTCEGGWKAVTDSPRTGITRNPHDPALTPGGSSGGSVVAVACGAGPLALGSDGGGSIRIPASFTGLFGIKPSYGRVPQFPLSAHYADLSHVGPLARTVDDAALMLDVMAGPSPLDGDSLPLAAEPFWPVGEAFLRDLRVGVTEGFGFGFVAPEVAAVFRTVVDRLRSAGAVIVDVPALTDWRPTYRVLWQAGAWQAQRRLDPAQRALIDPGFQAAAADGSRLALEDVLDATARRFVHRSEAQALFGSMDVLLCPAVAVPPFAVGQDVPDASFGSWLDWGFLSHGANLTGQPAASVPAGFTGAGLPVGVQATGRMNDEAGVLRFSKALAALLPEGRRSPAAVMAGLPGR